MTFLQVLRIDAVRRIGSSKDHDIRFHLWTKHLVILERTLGVRLTAHPQIYQKQEDKENEEEEYFLS
jgi:hypothetical protein